MSQDPFFCDGCDMELSHGEIETVPDVPRVSLDRFEFIEQSVLPERVEGTLPERHEIVTFYMI